MYVHTYGFPSGSVSKECTCYAGDAGDIGLLPRLGRFPGGGHGNPLPYYCLENFMDRGYGMLQFNGSQRVRHNYSD